MKTWKFLGAPLMLMLLTGMSWCCVSATDEITEPVIFIYWDYFIKIYLIIIQAETGDIRFMKEYIKLIRVKHYIKNFLIFAALLFSGQVFILEKLKDCVIGFAAFCFLSSVIYIFNDIKDKDKDALHPKKKTRPIASGKISVRSAVITAVILLIVISFL